MLFGLCSDWVSPLLLPEITTAILQGRKSVLIDALLVKPPAVLPAKLCVSRAVKALSYSSDLPQAQNAATGNVFSLLIIRKHTLFFSATASQTYFFLSFHLKKISEQISRSDTERLSILFRYSFDILSTSFPIMFRTG